MDYNAKLHRTGRIWTLLALIMMGCIPLFLCITLKTTPDFKAAAIAWLLLTVANCPVAIGEIATYSNLLGTNGTYLAFVTGNLSNLKIPCVVNAINIAETEVGTEENEIVSTISIAISAIVTVVIIGIGVLAFAPLQPIFSKPELKPAFDVVVFALFGALGGRYLVKYPAIAIAPIIAITLLCIVLIIAGAGGVVQASYMVFVGVILCVLNVKRLKKKGKLQ